ncbi:Card1-like endonuclease domain-containing protein [Anabaena sp. CCY 9402-a]|uniref:Card1-like endonuclease domain-containing protein n=1 Tax=Anabaena sp. CCY 9402-a TaxID=3103867 RepID=UPI0039C6ECF7
MAISDFDNYKVDHLFLLMGENSLPNYVTANLLLKKGGTPYLVHTTGTETQAKRLKNILNNKLIGLQSAQLISLGKYESDAYHIQDEICRKIQGLKNGKIGLNYTGGTKAMAVHAYRAVFSQSQADTVFSYLDARRLEMCIDREDRERIRIKIKPESLEIKLVELFQLHGLELKQKPTQQAQLPKLARELANIFQEESKAKQWFDGFYKVFREQAYKSKSNGGGEWKSKTALLEVSTPLDDLPQEIIAAFKEENFITSDNQLSLQQVEKTGAFKEIKHFCKWLDGLWLEHYVLEEVKNIADKQIKDYGLNFEIPLKGTRDGFEFDVAFTRGYQLFAISCSTTSNRGLCKSKLFEAYLRARQMGGDEARVALVCCFSEPDTLKAEIVASTNDKKIAVFGREHLKNLSEEISNWIDQNDEDAQ